MVTPTKAVPLQTWPVQETLKFANSDKVSAETDTILADSVKITTNSDEIFFKYLIPFFCKRRKIFFKSLPHRYERN